MFEPDPNHVVSGSTYTPKKRPPNRYKEAAEEARENPGQWVVAATNGWATLPLSIASGRVAAFRPRGEWEAANDGVTYKQTNPETGRTHAKVERTLVRWVGSPAAAPVEPEPIVTAPLAIEAPVEPEPVEDPEDLPPPMFNLDDFVEVGPPAPALGAFPAATVEVVEYGAVTPATVATGIVHVEEAEPVRVPRDHDTEHALSIVAMSVAVFHAHATGHPFGELNDYEKTRRIHNAREAFELVYPLLIEDLDS